MLRSCLRSLALAIVVTPHVLPDEVPPDEVNVERITIPLNNQPASDVAEMLRDVLGREPNVRVVSSPLTNIVVVEAPSSEVTTILELIREIDRPNPMITIEAIAVELNQDDATIKLQSGLTKDVKRLVADLQKRQVLHVIDRLKLTALSNQEAYVQVGQRAPNRTARQSTGRGGRVSSYEYQDVGVMLRCIARAARDGSVAMDIFFDKSTLAPSKPADVDDQPPMTVITTKLQSVVRLLPDESVVFGGLREDTESDENVEWRLIVSAQVK